MLASRLRELITLEFLQRPDPVANAASLTTIMRDCELEPTIDNLKQIILPVAIAIAMELDSMVEKDEFSNSLSVDLKNILRAASVHLPLTVTLAPKHVTATPSSTPLYATVDELQVADAPTDNEPKAPHAGEAAVVIHYISTAAYIPEQDRMPAATDNASQNFDARQRQQDAIFTQQTGILPHFFRRWSRNAKTLRESAENKKRLNEAQALALINTQIQAAIEKFDMFRQALQTCDTAMLNQIEESFIQFDEFELVHLPLALSNCIKSWGETNNAAVDFMNEIQQQQYFGSKELADLFVNQPFLIDNRIIRFITDCEQQLKHNEITMNFYARQRQEADARELAAQQLEAEINAEDDSHYQINYR